MAEIKKKNKKSVFLLNLILLLFLVTVYLNSQFRPIVEVIFYAFFSIYFLYKKGKFTIYSLWSFCIIIISGMTLLWTSDLGQSMIDFRLMVQMFLIGSLLIAYIDSENKIDDIYKMFNIAGVMLTLYILRNISIADLLNISTRIGFGMGAGMQNISLNSNEIGLSLVISAIFSFYLYGKSKNVYYIISVLLFALFIFLTGSRKAILYLVISIAGIVLLKSKNKVQLLKNIALASILVLILIYILLNVPVFYEIAGNRIEALFNAVVYGSAGDGSIQTRNMMYESGIRLIKENPIFGYGIGSYSKVSGIGTYSHNNYVELAVGIGIFGTAVFYSIYVFVIYHLIKLLKVEQIFPVAMIIIFLPFFEVGMVSYKILFWNIVIAVAYSVANVHSSILNEKTFK